MSAAAPTATAAELPADLSERQQKLNGLTVTALKALALKVGVPVEAAWKKPELVSVLAKSDDAMRAHGWPALEEPEAGTGDVDPNGDIIGGTIADDETPAGEAPEYDRAAVTVELDTAGFPLNGDDLPKLTDEHLANLKWQLVHVDGNDEPDVFPGRDELISWIERVGYQVPGQTTIDEQIAETEQADPVAERVATETAGEDAHIPTASPAPRTEKVCEKCSGAGGWQTDTEWESCSECCTEESGQLTLVPGGDAPAKSILNVAALRYDLARTEFKDGDTVTVSFDVKIDKIAFIPEKSGKSTKRRVRTHAGTIDQETVVVHLAS